MNLGHHVHLFISLLWFVRCHVPTVAQRHTARLTKPAAEIEGPAGTTEDRYPRLVPQSLASIGLLLGGLARRWCRRVRRRLRSTKSQRFCSPRERGASDADDERC